MGQRDSRGAAPGDREDAHEQALIRTTHQESLDVAGPRVDPRTRTGGEDVAGSVPDLAEGRDAASLDRDEPERQAAPGVPGE